MVRIIIINKNGECKEHVVKKIIFNELYKKCGFKNNNNFDKRITWNTTLNKKKIFINVFAKNNGRANNENKFDFPPPIDNDLYFGNIIITACINKNDENNVIDITEKMWLKIYENLMGGFEDIENTDDEEEEEEEEIPPELLTKHGYKKDGFIIDDEDDDDDEETDDETSETDDDSNDDDDDETDDDDDDDETDDDDDETDDDDDEYNNNKKHQKNNNKCYDSNVNNIFNEDNSDGLQEEEYCNE